MHTASRRRSATCPRVVLVEPVEEHDELVATQARDGVTGDASQRDNRFARIAQDRVADPWPYESFTSSANPRRRGSPRPCALTRRAQA
jgi:hypothetical protein